MNIIYNFLPKNNFYRNITIKRCHIISAVITQLTAEPRSRGLSYRGKTHTQRQHEPRTYHAALYIQQ